MAWARAQAVRRRRPRARGMPAFTPNGSVPGAPDLERVLCGGGIGIELPSRRLLFYFFFSHSHASLGLSLTSPYSPRLQLRLPFWTPVGGPAHPRVTDRRRRGALSRRLHATRLALVDTYRHMAHHAMHRWFAYRGVWVGFIALQEGIAEPVGSSLSPCVLDCSMFRLCVLTGNCSQWRPVGNL